MTNPQTLLDIMHLNTEEDMPTDSECWACRGRGFDPGDPQVGYKQSDCDECGGTGRELREWLPEALRLATFDHHSEVRRDHLRALAVHAVELVRGLQSELDMLKKPVQSETSLRKPATQSVEAA